MRKDMVSMPAAWGVTLALSPRPMIVVSLETMSYEHWSELADISTSCMTSCYLIRAVGPQNRWNPLNIIEYMYNALHVPFIMHVMLSNEQLYEYSWAAACLELGCYSISMVLRMRIRMKKICIFGERDHVTDGYHFYIYQRGIPDNLRPWISSAVELQFRGQFLERSQV